MEILQIIKEWVGVVSLLLTGIVWWFVKLNADKIKANEGAKQEVQHTAQEILATQEKDFELDSRRVKASEEVASETLEHLAETREENLKLLENNYNLRCAIVDLQFEVKGMKNEIAKIKEENTVIGFFYCGNTDCQMREPKLGTFQLNCLSIETLKKIMEHGK